MALAGELAKYIGGELVKNTGKELATNAATSALSNLAPKIATKAVANMANKSVLNSLVPTATRKLASGIELGNDMIPMFRGQTNTLDKLDYNKGLSPNSNGFFMTPNKSATDSWAGKGVVSVDADPNDIMTLDELRSLKKSAEKYFRDPKYQMELYNTNPAQAEIYDALEAGDNYQELSRLTKKPFIERDGGQGTELGEVVFFPDTKPELTGRYNADLASGKNQWLAPTEDVVASETAVPAGTKIKFDEDLNMEQVNAVAKKYLGEPAQSPNLSPIVADENGVAKTFYHGSPSMDITDFDINMAGKNTRSGERAIWFTDDYPTAEEFSYERIPGDTLFADKRGAKGKVYERNLGLENPLDLSNLSDKQIEELYKYADSRMAFDGKENFIRRMKEFRDAGNDQLMKSQLDMKKLSNSEYDGIVAKMYPGENEVREIGVFDPRKIKNVDKPNAKSSTTELSPQQQEFFKDSVVRDKNGELMPMYHGTRGDFTVFGEKNPSSSSNSKSGVGFWFTPSEEGAKNFASSIWYGDGEPKAMKTYLNMKNPKVYESVDNSKAVESLRKELDKIELKSKTMSKPKLYYKNMYDYSVAYNMVNQGDKDMAIKWLADKSSYDEKTATELIEEIDNMKKLEVEKKRIQDEISELKYGDAYERFRTDIYKVDGQTAEDANVGGIGMALRDDSSVQKYVDNLKAKGYDGIIIKGTNYDADTMGGMNDQYVVFDPEQIKNVDNRKPTKNKDIRYAIAAALGLGSIIGPYMNSKKSVDNVK